MRRGTTNGILERPPLPIFVADLLFFISASGCRRRSRSGGWRSSRSPLRALIDPILHQRDFGRAQRRNRRHRHDWLLLSGDSLVEQTPRRIARHYSRTLFAALQYTFA